MSSHHVLQFDDTDAGNLLHYRQGRNLDYIYEHMASVGSLDVVNLPTLSADTKMFLPRDDFTNQNQRQLCRYVLCYFFYLCICNFFTKFSNQHTNRLTTGHKKKVLRIAKLRRRKIYGHDFSSSFTQKDPSVKLLYAMDLFETRL